MEFYTDVQKSLNKILLRGFRDGVRFEEQVSYQPSLFERTDEETGYKNIYGDPVKRIIFDTMTAAKKYAEKNPDVMGMQRFIYPFLNERYPGKIEFNKEHVRIGTFDIEVGSDDGFPDPYIARKEVTAITIFFRGKYIVLTCGDKEFTPHRDDIIYVWAKDEKRMLEKFLQIWMKLDLDIISGWACETFDIPYMINRIKRVLGEEQLKKLSPWGQIRSREGFNKIGKPVTFYHIVGIHIIDYLEVYRKHAYISHENFKLDTVAFDDLGVKKTDYSEYRNLHTFYEENFQKFVEYNVRDVELIIMLDKKHGLFDLVLMYCYDSKINFSDVYGSVRLWDVAIHNELWDNFICVDPDVQEAPEDGQFLGAYVKDPEPGYYKLLECNDYTGLYPSLAVQCNISPETFVAQIDISDLKGTTTHTETGRVCITAEDVVNGFFEKNPDLVRAMNRENLALTANGCLWNKDAQGVLPRLIKRIMRERAEFKQHMIESKKMYAKNKEQKYEYEISKYDILQKVRKIQLNSLYGCLGNKYFRWYRQFAAEAITTTGQLQIRWTEHWINEKLNSIKWGGPDHEDFVVAIDTDSVYVSYDKFVSPNDDALARCKAAYEFSEKTIQPVIQAQNTALGVLLNVYEDFVKMKRETISDKGIWTAKKRYILNYFHEEGVWYEKAKLKMTGIEAVKTSTPAICREKIKEGLDIIMNKSQEDFFDFVEKFRQEFFIQDFDKIAFPRSVNGIDKYAPTGNNWVKGTPIHTRGAIVFNQQVKKHDLLANYNLIEDGDKIKYAYLETPNPTHSNCIAVPDVLPPEFGLELFIDYDAMFEKTFLAPFQPIVKAYGWRMEKRVSLFDEVLDDALTSDWGGVPEKEEAEIKITVRRKKAK